MDKNFTNALIYISTKMILICILIKEDSFFKIVMIFILDKMKEGEKTMHVRDGNNLNKYR